MKKIYLLPPLLLLNCNILFANYSTDSLLLELDYYLKIQNDILGDKELHISQLKCDLQEAIVEQNYQARFDILLQIVNGYEYYNYDSAMKYAKQLSGVVHAFKNGGYMNYVRSKQGFVMLSRGMFTEAFDSLKAVNTALMDKKLRVKHYAHLIRAYYDIADYTHDANYSFVYRENADALVDSVLVLSAEGMYNPGYCKALRYLVHYQLDSAKYYFERLLVDVEMNDVQLADVFSCLGFINFQLGHTNRGMQYTIQSAIAGIKAASYEPLALASLAQQFHRKGDIDKAYKYVKEAEINAIKYGSRLRQLLLLEIMPAIETDKVLKAERRKEKLLRFMLVTLLALLVLTLLVVVFVIRNRIIRKSQYQMEKANNELRQLNEKLKESNRIKVDYIGHYFNYSSKFIEKMTGLKKAVQGLLDNSNYKGVERIIKNINTEDEKRRLYSEFDSIFLNLFPSFITTFNKMLHPEEQMSINDEKGLNSYMRIYALMRLGIQDTESIAAILNFSVDSVYTYKSRLKKKMNVSIEEFEKQIMKVSSV
ncbi:MAG: DUF6377 domain-containing protein [Bacteroidales bacterium]|nr:DUF6377 domain-containing protein [Bacteroidales bacterium]